MHNFRPQPIALILTLVLLLTGCAAPAAAPSATAAPPIHTETIQLTDGLGRDVTLAEPAGRVVSLAASNTEILYAIGAGNLLVGRDDTSDYPDEAFAVESIGSVYGAVNTEAILALEPDLVLAAGTNTPEQVETLAALDLTVFYLANPVDFEGLYENIRLVGALTGRVDAADALIADLTTRVENVRARVAELEPVSVYYEVDATDVTAPYTVGAGTFQNYLITLAGGANIAADLNAWAPISQEELLARNPDVMLFGSSIWVPTTVESVAARPGWSALYAVASGQVYPIDSNWVDRPGPRLVLALEAMADLLHPAD